MKENKSKKVNTSPAGQADAVLAFCVSCYCHGVEGVGAVAFFVDSIIFFITDKYLIFKFCAYSFYEIVDSFGVVKCNHFYGFLSFLYLF